MKKRVFLIGLALMMSVQLWAQQTIHSRQVDAFRTVDLSGDLTVELIRSDTAGVDIVLSHTTIEKLEWGVKDGTLFMRLKPGSSANARGEVKLYYRDFNTLKISRSSVKAQDVLSGTMLDIQLSAGATFSGAVHAKDLNLKVNGNSAADISGSVKYFTLNASGKSKVNTRDLETTDANIVASSTAEVYVWAQERLQAVAESGGAVYYKGTPEIFRSTTKMMGTINNIGQ